MKIRLPGTDVQHIRKAFGMEIDAFASILAVHPTTVRRWEAAGLNPISVDGVAASVLAVARQRLARTPPPPPEDVRAAGNEAVDTLMGAGALLALVMLVTWLTEKR